MIGVEVLTQMDGCFDERAPGGIQAFWELEFQSVLANSQVDDDVLNYWAGFFCNNHVEDRYGLQYERVAMVFVRLVAYSVQIFLITDLFQISNSYIEAYYKNYSCLLEHYFCIFLRYPFVR